MGHADRGRRLVDVLAAGAAGAIVIDANVLHVDIHVDRLVQLRHNVDRRKGRMAPRVGVKRRNADQAVDPLLAAEKP